MGEILVLDGFTQNNIFFIIYNIGNLLSFLAFWTKDLLTLRWTIAIGLAFTSLYYFASTGGPYYNTLFWMVPTFLINVWMIIQIYREKRDIGIGDDVRALFNKIAVLTPKQFKSLIAISSRTTGNGGEILSQGANVDRLYFLLKGAAKLTKGNYTATVREGIFLGEIAFITQSFASATVELHSESECLSWDTHTLRDLMKRQPAIDIAIRGIFNRDLAEKVANSVPIN
jgi:Cyclic nucleotide-binding domain